MKTMKKLFAVLLAVMLVLSLAPTAALAADTAALVIHDDTLTVTPAVVSAGEQFTIKIKVTDAESDISNVSAYAWLPNGTTEITQQELTRVDDSDFFEAEFTVPLSAQNGIYSIGISAQDNFSNTDYKSFSDALTVMPTDVTGPEIAAPSVAPELLKPGETLSISSIITDVSTVNSACVYLIAPNQTETRYDLNKDGESDKWKADIVLPTNVLSGEWSIRIEAFDGQENRSERVVNNIFTVAVPVIPVTDITLNSLTMTLNIGKTAPLAATVLPSNATNKALKWTSSAPAVAKVDANGKVTAVTAGIANITASAQDGSGKKITCTVKVPPAVVSGVKAVNAGSNVIKVSWSKVTGASGYQVCRSTSSGGTYQEVGTVTGNGTVSFTNTGLTAGKNYSYKVRAYTKVGSSTVYGSYSTVVSAKPLPVKVSSPKAASAGYDRIKVSWTQVSGANGYEVYRATSSTGAYSRIKTVTSGSTVSYTNTGLTFNKTYYYKVRAYRTVSNSKVYGSFSAVVNAKTALGKVSSPKAVAPDYKSIKLSWSRVSGAGGYEIYRATSSGGTYSRVKTITNGSTVSFTNTGLTADNTYYYKIRAYRNASGKIYGGFSSVISATPKYGTVYWVPKGTVFHVRRSCSTLANSKIVNSGTVSASGKGRCCKRCG